MNQKIIKLVSTGVLLVLLAFFAFVFYIKNSIDVNQLKNTINNAAIAKIEDYNKHYHFKDKDIRFAIKNSVKISFSLTPKLIINGFEAQNVQYKDMLVNISIKKIEVKLAFADFFAKKLTPKGVNVSGVSVYLNYNKLDDFYYTVEKRKKIVKLEDNEVSGVRDRLKNFLTSTEGEEVQEIKEGYREAEVDETVRYDVDNSKVTYMFTDLIKGLSFGSGDLPEITFSNSFLTIAKGGNIQKEFKNISGSLEDHKDEKRFKSTFVLNNINGELNVSIKNNEGKYDYVLDIKNNMKDKINLTYNGDDIFQKNFKNAKANINFDVSTPNFNNLVQWILPTTSKFYYMFDYKKAINISSTVNKNDIYYTFKDLTVDAEDIKLKANVDFTELVDNIDFNVEKLNLDEFIVNFSENKLVMKPDNINIFKFTTFDSFIASINNNTNLKNKKINLQVKDLIKGDKTIKSSNVNIDINNNIYKINSFDINLNSLKMKVDEAKELNGIFYNNLIIEGNDFSELANFISADKFLKIGKFKLTSKILINNNIAYLYDYNLTDKDGKSVATGNIEYSMKNEGNYLAISSNMESLDVVIDEQKTSTLKEKFLWLNSITSNVFMDLNINKLNYNEDTFFIKSKIHYYPGFVNLYNISNITTENIKNITGQSFIGIGSKDPVIRGDLKIASLTYEDDLINTVFDMEKYKNAILRTKINEEIQDKYWVNRLFSIPTFEEVGGNITIKVDNIKINDSEIKDFEFKGTIENGSIEINKFKFSGLGGSTEIRGNVDLKRSRSVNLILSDTIYDLSEIFKLFSKNKRDDIGGTVGTGGLIKANGFNPSVFLASMNYNFKFISNNLYIKKLGLENLRDTLSDVYRDDEKLANFRAEDIILDDSGTTFNNVSGRLLLASNVNNFTLDAKANSISTKFISKIDNSSKNMIIDIINTSVISTKVGEKTLPLYATITFKEDFSNKANLNINTTQIDEYVSKIRKTKGIKEPKKIKKDYFGIKENISKNEAVANGQNQAAPTTIQTTEMHRQPIGAQTQPLGQTNMPQVTPTATQVAPVEQSTGQTIPATPQAPTTTEQPTTQQTNTINQSETPTNAITQPVVNNN